MKRQSKKVTNLKARRRSRKGALSATLEFFFRRPQSGFRVADKAPICQLFDTQFFAN